MAECVQRLPHHGLHLLLVRHIRLDPEALNPLSPDLFHHSRRPDALVEFLEGFQVDIVHDDVGTQPCKPQGVRPPDGPRAPRDQSDLPLELHVFLLGKTVQTHFKGKDASPHGLTL